MSKFTPTALRRIVKRKHDRTSENGAAVTEGALVFLLFFGLILAVIEFGVFFMFWSTGRNAASESAHEAAVVGADSAADFATLRAARTQLNQIGGRLDYFIIYRASSIREEVPAECLAAAEAGKNNLSATAPHGYFQTKDGQTSVEAFDWRTTDRPKIACNVYYRRNVSLAVPNGEAPFRYNVDDVATTPSLDRFWPGGFRTDWITGPVDYVGIYIQTRYTTLTGIVPSRVVKHRAIVQIEPKRGSRR
jgi:hypothetical protein